MLLESGADPWDVSDFALRTASERGHGAVLRAIRQAQVATSTATGEGFLLGSSGSIDSGAGSHTPRMLVTPTCRWSVSPPYAVAGGGRWSACLPAAMHSTCGPGPVLGTTGKAEEEALDVALYRMYESPPCGFNG